MSYRRSHVGTGRGESYDTTFGDGYLGHLWREVERPLVAKTLRRLRDDGARTCLDFACGTGRISVLNEEIFPECFGVDISPDMLSEAERRCSSTRFFLGDVTVSPPADLPLVDVVTAFRFFLNAEDALRQDVLAALHRQLVPGGHLVMNVQWNSASPSGFVYGARNRLSGMPRTTASFREMDNLLSSNGFRVVYRKGYGVFPWFGDRLDASSGAGVARAERATTLFPVLEKGLQHFLLVAVRV